MNETRKQIFQEIIDSPYTTVEPSLDSKFDDLGMDELDVSLLTIYLEGEFNADTGEGVPETVEELIEMVFEGMDGE
jgi:hypothetical protein